MQFLYVIFIFIFLSACTTDKSLHTQEIKKPEYISDLKEIPQDSSVYTKGIDRSGFDSENFERKYFRVWNLEKISISVEEAMWPYRAFRYGNSYGENLQLINQDFFDKILENSNFKNYATVNKRAVSLKLLNIRAFPTDKPLLRDPTKAGEGFPFDYMQNSSIAANKPLFVSHYSQDKKWAYIESSFAFGWVKVRDIVLIDKKYTDIWQNAQQIFIVKDGTPIYSKNNHFLFESRIGMLFALIEEDAESFSVLTLTKDENSQAIYTSSKLSKKIAHKGILDFKSENIDSIITQLSKTNYGWGGLYGQRDCSSTLRDFYTPFGLWLPRNSFAQSKIGETISLNNLDDAQKIALIKEKATPFETLLYKQGHIMLYVGTFNDKIVIFQNVWGVRTKKDNTEGRFIIGKAIFSTLTFGSNLKNYDDSSSLLTNLKSFNNLRE